MVIAKLIKERLSLTPAGVVLTTRDFGVEMRYLPISQRQKELVFVLLPTVQRAKAEGRGGVEQRSDG